MSCQRSDSNQNGELYANLHVRCTLIDRAGQRIPLIATVFERAISVDDVVNDLPITLTIITPIQ